MHPLRTSLFATLTWWITHTHCKWVSLSHIGITEYHICMCSKRLPACQCSNLDAAHTEPEQDLSEIKHSFEKHEESSINRNVWVSLFWSGARSSWYSPFKIGPFCVIISFCVVYLCHMDHTSFLGMFQEARAHRSLDLSYVLIRWVTFRVHTECVCVWVCENR